MTMPTASVSASRVMTFRVKPMYCIAREGGDERARDGDGGDDVGRKLREEEQHDARREERAQDQVLLHRVDRGHDELRLVAHDVHLPARGQLRAQLLDALLDAVDDLDGVGARLLADLQDHGGLAVDAGDGLGLGHAVLDPGHVADPHRVAAARGDRDVARTPRASATRP